MDGDKGLLDGGAVREVADLARRAAAATVEIDGRAYATTPLHDPRRPEPLPDPLEVASLGSVVDYVRGADAAYRAGRHLFVHVASPSCVRLLTDLFGAHAQRAVLVEATAAVPAFSFGTFLDPEAFAIGLQVAFEDTSARRALQAFAGGLQAEAVQTLADDGVAQVATVRKGIVSLAKAPAPNPVTLRAYRTFAEVVPPEAPFVFRLRGGGDGRPPACALFEADGGAWRREAVEATKEWLGEALTGTPVTSVYG